MGADILGLAEDEAWAPVTAACDFFEYPLHRERVVIDDAVVLRVGERVVEADAQIGRASCRERVLEAV
jgi:hypothetical protein